MNIYTVIVYLYFVLNQNNVNFMLKPRLCVLALSLQCVRLWGMKKIGKQENAIKEIIGPDPISFLLGDCQPLGNKQTLTGQEV